MSFVWLVTGLLIASPHILYAFIWFNPSTWRAWFGAQSVEVFAEVAAVGKGKNSSALPGWLFMFTSEGNGPQNVLCAVIQFTAGGVWFYLARGSLNDLALVNIPKVLWLPCLALMISGQVSHPLKRMLQVPKPHPHIFRTC